MERDRARDVVMLSGAPAMIQAEMRRHAPEMLAEAPDSHCSLRTFRPRWSTEHCHYGLL